jgi:hypothetical protein
MKLTQPMYEKRMNYLIISFRGVAELTVVVRYAHPIMVFDQKLLRKSSVINLIKVNGWVRGWMAQALCRLSSRLFFFYSCSRKKNLELESGLASASHRPIAPSDTQESNGPNRRQTCSTSYANITINTLRQALLYTNEWTATSLPPYSYFYS